MDGGSAWRGLAGLGRVAALVAAAVASGGCLTPGPMQTANTLGRYRVQVGVEPAFWDNAGGGGGVPGVDVAFRYGAGDTLALGGFLGVSLWLRPGFRLVPEIGVADPVVTSPAPPRPGSVGGMFPGPNGGVLLHAGVAVLIGGG